MKLVTALLLCAAQSAALLTTRPMRVGAMPAGGCTLYDSRLLHGGGPNESPRKRWLMYFSFCPTKPLMNELRGNAYGELQKAGHRLRDLEGGAPSVAVGSNLWDLENGGEKALESRDFW